MLSSKYQGSLSLESTWRKRLPGRENKCRTLSGSNELTGLEEPKEGSTG
jgi:hypothetical protein